MDNYQEADDPEDVIESSQVPKLRSKVRISRPNYRAMLFTPERTKKPRKRPQKRIHDNKTVSQYLRQVWTHPLKVPPPVAAAPKSTFASTTTDEVRNVPDEPDEECYIKLATQQEPPPRPKVAALQPTPSVSLFEHQERVLARYILSETIETQVDEELQRLLDGFQEEYGKDCAELAVAASPKAGHSKEQEHVAGDASLQPTCLPGEDVEPFPAERRATPPPPIASEPFMMPDFNKEIAELEKMMEDYCPPRTDAVTVPSTDTFPTVPADDVREKLQTVTPEPTVSMVTEKACWDLSLQKGTNLNKPDRAPTAMSIDEECTKAKPHFTTTAKPYEPSTSVVSSNSNRHEDALDLRISWKPPSAATSSNRPANAIHCGTQTNLRPKCRNTGIQHRPVASFDFTERNLLVLARHTESDPVRLRRQLKSISKASTQPIWQERDLSTAFSMADPYYANLKHFL